MKHTNRIHSLSAGILVLTAALTVLSSCKKTSPQPYRAMPKQYDLAYQEIYGHCYDSVPYAVVALDLYSDSLTLDKNHRIHGTGYNLYLSDIFVPDSLLATGEYHSLRPDSLSPKPFTFLPGKDYEGYPSGMYILNIEEDKIIQIQLLDSGRFVYRNDSILFTLYYRNTYGTRSTYECSFHGTLIPWLKK